MVFEDTTRDRRLVGDVAAANDGGRSAKELGAEDAAFDGGRIVHLGPNGGVATSAREECQVAPSHRFLLRA